MFDNIFYTEAFDPDELAFEASMERENIRLDKLFSLKRFYEEQAEIKYRECELTCFAESGDMDYLEELYTEAKQQQEQQQEGVLSKIKDALVSLWEKIRNFFTGNSNKIDPNATYSGPKKLLMSFSKFLGALATPAKIFGMAFAAVASAFAIIKVFKKLTGNKDGDNGDGNDQTTAVAIRQAGSPDEKSKVKGEFIKGIIDKFSQISGRIKDFFKNEKNPKSDAQKTSNIISRGFNRLVGLFKKEGSSNNNNGENEEDETGLETMAKAQTSTDGDEEKNKTDENK